MEETVMSRRFMVAPYLARLVEMVWIASSMRASDASAPPAVAPARFVDADSSVVRLRPPKVSVIWSLAVLSSPIWNWMFEAVEATSWRQLNLAEPWMRDISDLRDVNSV